MINNLGEIKVVFSATWTGENAVRSAEKSIEKVASAEKKAAAASNKFAEAGQRVDGWIRKAGLAAGAAAVAFYGLERAATKGFQFLQQGAAVAQLEISFNRLNDTMLHTPDLLDNLTTASRGTITEMEAMQSFLTLVAGTSQNLGQQFAQAAPKLMEIAKAATVLNPTLGNTTFMFDSLARGIKRSEIRIIDNLGLNLKVGDANRKLAEQLGKSVEALTAEERQVALLNEVLRVGDNLIQQVGGSTDSMIDPTQRVTTALKQMRDELGKAFAEATLDNIGDMSAAVDMLGESFSVLADISIPHIRAILDMINRQAGTAGVVMSAKNISRQYGIPIDQLYSATNAPTAFIDSPEDQKRYMQDLATTQRRLKAAERLLQQGFDPQRTQAQGTGAIYQRRQNVERLGQLAALMEGPAAFAAEMEKLGQMIRPEQIFEPADLDLRRLNDSARTSIGIFREASNEVNTFGADLAALGEMSRSVRPDEDAIPWKEYITNLRQALGESFMAFGQNEDLINRPPEFITVGGRTDEQNELLDDLQSAYDRAAEAQRDYTSGLKGFGMEQEDVNEKIAEASEQMAYYAGLMEPLKGITGEVVATNQQMSLNLDALREVYRQTAIDYVFALDGMKASTLDLMVATGQLSQEEADLRLRMVEGETAVKYLAKAYQEDFFRGGKMSADDFSEAMEHVLRLIDETPEEREMRLLLNAEMFNERVNDPEAAAMRWRLGLEDAVEKDEPTLTMKMAEEALKQARADVEEAIGFDPYVAKVEADMDPAREEFNRFVADIENTSIIVRFSAAGAAAEPTRGGYQAPGGAAGLDMMVPAGFSNDTFPIWASSGERVTIDTPGKSRREAGDTYNINNYNREAAAVAMAWIGAGRRARLDERMGVAA